MACADEITQLLCDELVAEQQHDLSSSSLESSGQAPANPVGQSQCAGDTVDALRAAAGVAGPEEDEEEESTQDT
jgi:hypothetical protein